MCSIMGLTKAIPQEELLPYFMRTVSRGPDMHRIEQAGEDFFEVSRRNY